MKTHLRHVALFLLLAVAALAAETTPQSGQPWENTFEMKFIPVPGTAVLFSVWDTRVQDYEKFAAATRREWSKSGDATHPAVNVNRDDLDELADWPNYRITRLPLWTAGEKAEVLYHQPSSDAANRRLMVGRWFHHAIMARKGSHHRVG